MSKYVNMGNSARQKELQEMEQQQKENSKTSLRDKIKKTNANFKMKELQYMNKAPIPKFKYLK